ncbi:MAG: VTT domain-containing protein [Pseudomonadota bacterium]
MSLARRHWPSGLAIAALLALVAFGTWRLLDNDARLLFDYLAMLERWVQQQPFWTAVALVLVLGISTAATLPTVTVMTMTAGFLYGTVIGAALSMLGSILGALITFIVVRKIIGERVRNYASSGRLSGLVRLIERDAFFYLMGLRIVPVAPFFVLNAAGALIRISLPRFLLATGLGLIPILFIFAGVGAGLDTLIGAQDIGMDVFLEPEVLWPLLALVGLILIGATTKNVIRTRRQDLLDPAD